MTTAQLITRVKSLVGYDLDLWQGAVPLDVDMATTLTEIQYEVGEAAFLFDPVMTLTLTATNPGIFDLRTLAFTPKKVIKVFDVVISGNLMRAADGQSRGKWSLQELERQYPNWRTDPSATPTKYVELPDSKILLHPAPNSSTAGLATHFVSGTYFAVDIDSTIPTAVCGLPIELHEPLARITAARSCDPTKTEPHQFNRLKDMEEKAWNYVMMVGKRNKGSSFAGGTTSGSAYEGLLRI